MCLWRLNVLVSLLKLIFSFLSKEALPQPLNLDSFRQKFKVSKYADVCFMSYISSESVRRGCEIRIAFFIKESTNETNNFYPVSIRYELKYVYLIISN